MRSASKKITILSKKIKIFFSNQLRRLKYATWRLVRSKSKYCSFYCTTVQTYCDLQLRLSLYVVERGTSGRNMKDMSPAITTPDYSEHNIIYAINLYVWRDPDISTGSRPYCPWVITEAVAQSFFGGRESFIKNYTAFLLCYIFTNNNKIFSAIFCNIFNFFERQICMLNCD